MDKNEEVKEVLKQIVTEGDKKEEPKEKEVFYKKWWFWLIIVIISILIVTSGSGEKDNTTQTLNNTINNTNSTSNKINNTNTKVEKAKVTVVDFSQMSKEEIQNWCNMNKVSCTITEKYSDTIAKGLFISQSAEANSTVYEGDKITVIYSLGKEPTLGQKNALKTAKDYLRTMSFSYTGLIKQLEYEGYSKEEATYGADNCGADWNEQAAKMAKEYMNTMSFSRSGLISQLKYEGFTNIQAEYGASAVGY